MKYKNIKHGTFKKRINRFVAEIVIDGVTEKCHVKNTGRCGELFVAGADVLVQECDGGNRKTKYDLISVYKDDKLFNVDSQSPNKVVNEFLQSGGLFEKIMLIKPETKYKNSRFDFYVETETEKAFIEVKGVNLVIDGVAYFPDAPTDRGVKHIKELCECVKDGYNAYVIFVVQTAGVYSVMPNYDTHIEFAKTLEYAANNGIKVLAYNSRVGEDFTVINEKIDVCFR